MNDRNIYTLCMSIAGQSDVAPNDEPDIIETNETRPTNQTTAPCAKPRRYDVSDMGISYLYKGWADVQGQGAANDFCRYVYINHFKMYPSTLIMHSRY